MTSLLDIPIEVHSCQMCTDFRNTTQDDSQASREQAPQRYELTGQGRGLTRVSEAVAAVIQEDADLSGSESLQYVRNPRADMNLDQQQQDEANLTIDPIRNFVSVGPPEAHTRQTSFLLRTGCQAGTTTNSTLKIQHGHIPGAIERFKSRQQLQDDAFKYVQEAGSDGTDKQQLQKLYEQYKLITGLTDNETLPAEASEVQVCKVVEDVVGKTRLYSGQHVALSHGHASEGNLLDACQWNIYSVL